MAAITYTTLASLVAGSPEKIADVVDCLQKITAQTNGNLDTTNIAANGVGTTQLAANAVTAAKIEAQQAWQSITPSGAGVTWSAVDVQYMKDSLGFLHMRGRATASTIPTAGSTFLTLPAGFRPVARAAFPSGLILSASDFNRCIMSVDPAGTMFFESIFGATGGSQTAIFDVVSFKAV